MKNTTEHYEKAGEALERIATGLEVLLQQTELELDKAERLIGKLLLFSNIQTREEAKEFLLRHKESQ